MKSLRKALSSYRCVPLVFIFCCAWSLIIGQTGFSDTKASEVVEPREPPAGPDKDTYYVQVGAFVAPSPIEASCRKLEQSGFNNVKQAKVFHRGRWFTRVMVGPYGTRQDAERVMAELKGLGMEAFIRREHSHAKSAPVLREPEEKKPLVAVSEPKPVPIEHFQLVQPQGLQKSTQAMEADDEEALRSNSPTVLQQQTGQVSEAAPVSPTELREPMKSLPRPEQAVREEPQIALRNRSDVSLQEGVVAAAESTQAESEKAGEPGIVGTPEQKEAREKKIREATEPILLETRNVLLPQGTLVVEPSFNYSHFDQNLITISGFTLFEAIVIGKIAVEEIDRDILTGQLTLRYGILDRLQAELEIPYLYRRDRLSIPTGTGGAEESELIDDSGLGDIEGGLVLHAYRGRGWKPDILVNIRGKSRSGRDPYDLDTKTVEGQEIADELPTGTGHYGVSAGFNLVKVSDPAVFFGGANYFWNLERDVTGGFGEIDPGNSIEYFLGMAFALSEKTSLNFSFQNIFTQETKVEDENIPASELNAATLFAGVSHRISPKVSLLATVGVGLSEDAPDFQIQFNLPIYFSIF